MLSLAPGWFAWPAMAKSVVEDIKMYAAMLDVVLAVEQEESTKVGLSGLLAQDGSIIPGNSYLPLLMMKNSATNKTADFDLRLRVSQAIDIASKEVEIRSHETIDFGPFNVPAETGFQILSNHILTFTEVEGRDLKRVELELQTDGAYNQNKAYRVRARGPALTVQDVWASASMLDTARTKLFELRTNDPNYRFFLRSEVLNRSETYASNASARLSYYCSSDLVIDPRVDSWLKHKDVEAPLNPLEGTLKTVPLPAPRLLTDDEGTEVPGTCRVSDLSKPIYYGACIWDEVEDKYNCSPGIPVKVVREFVPPDQQQPPDLIAEISSISISTTVTGNVTLDVTVKNEGLGASSPTKLYYQRLTESQYEDEYGIWNSAQTYPDSTDVVWLISSTSLDFENVDLDPPSEPGTYRFRACVKTLDNESNTDNNCSAWKAVSVMLDQPDLIARIDDTANATTTGKVRLDVTVKNQGQGASEDTYLYYQRLTEAQYEAEKGTWNSARRYGTETETNVDRLTAGESRSYYSIPLASPSTAGTYRFRACVNKLSDESNKNNNCSAWTEVEVSPPAQPDLKVSIDEANTTTSGRVRLNMTVKNEGQGGSSPTYLYYQRLTEAQYEDEKGTWNSARRYGTKTETDVDELTAGESRSYYSIPLASPSEPGTYRFRACVNPLFTESDDGNNCSIWKQVVISQPAQPDLVVRNVGVDDSSPSAGSTIRMDADVYNQGDATASSTTLRYYRSTNSTISRSDTELDDDPVSSLASRTTSSEYDTNLPVPSDEGTYYYGACVDAVSNESGTNNNCSSGVRVDVQPPVQQAFSLHSANAHPAGITYRSDRFYVVDSQDKKVYVYDDDGDRDTEKEFSLHSANTNPTGITYGNRMLYVSDSKYSGNAVYKYLFSSGGYNGHTFLQESGGRDGNPRGITYRSNRFYVVDSENMKVYAYSRLGGRFKDQSQNPDFSLHTANAHPAGITDRSGRFYVVDLIDKKVYVYDDGDRDTDREFSLYDDNTHPAGITYRSNGRFYVVDFEDKKVYVYQR